MAIKETSYFVLLIMLPVAMMAKQPTRAWDDIDNVHASTPEDYEPSDQTIGKCNGKEMKKQIESIKSLLEDLSTKVESCQQCQDACPAVPVTSCKELYEKHHLTTSQVCTLKFGSQKIPVYCHMGNFGCGDGGWTLAMKIDGTKKTFHYDAHLWKDTNPYNIAGGQTDFDTQETKLPTYWNTPFSKICLGMRIGNENRFVVINMNANSLYSLIADGQYRATSLGRNRWKHLIGSQASLQRNCNKEGFNAVSDDSRFSKARIGILGNDQYVCNYCDSRIGFGTGGLYDDTNTCGNEANRYAPDNGPKHIKTMGYILVQ